MGSFLSFLVVPFTEVTGAARELERWVERRVRQARRTRRDRRQRLARQLREERRLGLELLRELRLDGGWLHEDRLEAVAGRLCASLRRREQLGLRAPLSGGLEAEVVALLRAVHARALRCADEERESRAARVHVRAFLDALPAPAAGSVWLGGSEMASLAGELAEVALRHAPPAYWSVEELRELPFAIQELLQRILLDGSRPASRASVRSEPPG